MWGLSRRGGLVAAIIGITLTLGSPMAAAPGDPADPISGIGHGVAFDPSGREINVTPRFIREAQEFYIRRLSGEADVKTRKDFDKLRPVVQTEALSEQARLVGNGELIAWLIARVRPTDAAELAGKNNFLRSLLRQRLSPFNQPITGDEPVFVLPNELLARFATINAALEGAGFVAVPEPQSYAKECDAAGVPVPPDWGDKRWVSKGVLSDVFISGQFEAEVFVYDSASPKGLCIALPRSKGATTKLLGIICSGKESGKACFWDNQVNDKTVPIPKGLFKPLAGFAAGPELEGGEGGICTSCHRGENPFIIHPLTALGLPNLKGLQLRTDRWYKPIVAAAWPQNPGPGSYSAPEGSAGECTECHIQAKIGRFPSLEAASQYCVEVLKPAIEKTMPTGRAGHVDYAAHAQVLLAACPKDLNP
jgi:hypothetical protein